MNELFADWHRLVGVDPKPDELTSRWKPVERTARALGRDQAINLLDLAALRPGAADMTEDFVKPFKTADPTFPIRENAVLLQVLASAVLIERLATCDGVASLIAYGLAAAGHVGWTFGIDDLERQGSTFLAVEANARLGASTHAPLPDAVSKSISKRIGELESTDLEEFAPAHVGAALRDIWDTLEAALATQESQRARQLESLREETNLLWWLIAGKSSILGQPWERATHGEAAVAAAWEVVSLVERLPAHPALARLLDRVLTISGSDTQVDVAKSLEALPIEMTPRLPGILEPLTPVYARWLGHETSLPKRINRKTLAHRLLSETLLIRSYEAAT